VRLFSFSSASALRSIILVALAIVTPITFTGCGSSAFSGPPSTKVALAAPAATAAAVSSAATDAAATPVQGSSSTTPVLLFNGTGTLASDVAAVEVILNTLKLTYATADSSHMNSMSEATLKTYKLFIVPGGNSNTIGNNLSKAATTNIHNAVQSGLHYLGICAGGWFGGYAIANGLNLTSGVWFNVYDNYDRGTGSTAVEISYPNGTKLDQFWHDGPEFSGWGSIVGKYPDGTPAIVEGKSGSGWVILSGIHAEAPASWRYGMKFTTSVAVDHAYAGTLVTAALNGTSLPHF
jgi:glutamine amidotransferase-like uncharacterized protein